MRLQPASLLMVAVRGFGSLALACCVLLAPNTVSAQQPTRYWTTSFSLRDADVAKLSQRLSLIGIGLPFSLQGNITTELEIGIPLGALREPRAYRLDGIISSAQLTVAGVRLDALSAQLTYRDGTLDLDPITFQLPDAPGSAPGRFVGDVRLGLSPLENLEAELSLSDAPLRPIAQQIEGFPELQGGRLTGTLTAAAPLDTLGDLRTWEADGELVVSLLTLFDRTLRRAVVEFEANEGVLRTQKFLATMDGATVNGSARLDLTTPFDYSADLTLASLNFAELAGIPDEEPPQYAGKLALKAHAEGTLNPQKFIATGNAALNEAVLAGIDVPRAGFEFSSDDQAMKLQEVFVQVLGGRLEGGATYPRQEDSRFTAELRIAEPLNLAQLAEQVVGQDVPITGQLEGEITATTPTDKLSDVGAWDIRMTTRVTEGTVYGLTISPDPIVARLVDRTLTLSETDLAAGRTALAVSGTVQITEPYPYSSQVRLAVQDLADLADLSADLQLPAETTGAFTADLTARGDLSPFRMNASGQVASDGFRIAGAAIDSLTAAVTTDGTQLELTKFDLALYGGTVIGKAALPLRPAPRDRDAAGTFSLDWKQVDIGSLATDVTDFGASVQGQFSGSVQGQYLPNQAAPLPWRFTSQWEVPSIQVEGIEAGNLKGAATLTADALSYDVTGQMFDGDLSLEGVLPLAGNPAGADAGRPPAARDRGELRLTDFSLDRLFEVFGSDAATGSVTMRLGYQHRDAESLPTGDGTLRVTDLQWDGQEITSEIEAVLALRGSRLLVSNLGGQFAGGRLAADLAWDFRSPADRRLVLSLVNADAASVGALLPDEEAAVEGRFDLRATIQLGEQWRADARVTFRRGTVGGVAFGSLSLPIRATFSPSGERGEVFVTAANGTLGGGRFRGGITGRWDGGTQVSGQIEFANVDPNLLGSVGSSAVGGGRVKGTLRISGRNMQSLGDLTATVQAEFGESRTDTMPFARVLSIAVPGVSLSQPAEGGSLRGRLRAGIFIVEEFRYRSSTLALQATGTVTLAGRLNLEVVLATGDFGPQRDCAQFLLARLTDTLAAPVGLLFRIQKLLSNRLLYLVVRGTVNRPVVTVRPLPILAEGTLRFFLEQAAGTSGAPF